MDNFEMAVMMLKKIRPKPFDKKWIEASSLLTAINKKSTKFIDEKKAKFVWIVDNIYKELEDGNKQ